MARRSLRVPGKPMPKGHFKRHFFPEAELPRAIQLRFDAWLLSPPKSQFRTYGLWNTLFMTIFQPEHYLVKPQKLLRPLVGSGPPESDTSYALPRLEAYLASQTILDLVPGQSDGSTSSTEDLESIITSSSCDSFNVRQILQQETEDSTEGTFKDFGSTSTSCSARDAHEDYAKQKAQGSTDDARGYDVLAEDYSVAGDAASYTRATKQDKSQLEVEQVETLLEEPWVRERLCPTSDDTSYTGFHKASKPIENQSNSYPGDNALKEGLEVLEDVAARAMLFDSAELSWQESENAFFKDAPVCRLQDQTDELHDNASFGSDEPFCSSPQLMPQNDLEWSYIEFQAQTLTSGDSSEDHGKIQAHEPQLTLQGLHATSSPSSHIPEGMGRFPDFLLSASNALPLSSPSPDPGSIIGSNVHGPEAKADNGHTQPLNDSSLGSDDDEKLVNVSVDSCGVLVENRGRIYPDFTIDYFWGANKDENPLADLVLAIVEIASLPRGDLTREQREKVYWDTHVQLTLYMNQATTERWSGILFGICIVGVRVQVIEWVDELGSLVEHKSGWMSIFDPQFVKEIAKIKAYAESQRARERFVIPKEFPRKFDPDDTVIPYSLQARIDAWDLNPEKYQHQTYGPWGAFFQLKFPIKQFLVKPQRPIRGIFNEKSPDRDDPDVPFPKSDSEDEETSIVDPDSSIVSTDSTGKYVKGFAKFPDLTIDAIRANPGKHDVVLAICEIGSKLDDYTKNVVRLQLFMYKRKLGVTRWERKLLGIGIIQNQVLLIMWRRGPRGGNIYREEIGWISIYDKRFIEELEAIREHGRSGLKHGLCSDDEFESEREDSDSEGDV